MTNRMPWDRPIRSLMPNRMGDRNAEPIFAAVGRAVSAWEGVQAATSSLYLSMSTRSGKSDADPNFRAFGGLKQVHKRRKELQARGRVFLSECAASNPDAAGRFGAQLKDVLAGYVGWAERRNDIAHGYVTQAQCPDYSDVEQNIVTVYALCPSHARIEKWPHREPEYNYVAAELEEFARSFQHLDGQLMRLAGAASLLLREDGD